MHDTSNIVLWYNVFYKKLTQNKAVIRSSQRRTNGYTSQYISYSTLTTNQLLIPRAVAKVESFRPMFISGRDELQPLSMMSIASPTRTNTALPNPAHSVQETSYCEQSYSELQ